MDNALYVGLSRQMTLRRELDIVANNIANTNTTGFKVEDLMVATEQAKPAKTLDGASPVKFVLDTGVARDFTQGAMTKTGGDFDLAIDGKGFFKSRPPLASATPATAASPPIGRPAGHPGRLSSPGRRRRPAADRPGPGPGLDRPGRHGQPRRWSASADRRGASRRPGLDGQGRRQPLPQHHQHHAAAASRTLASNRACWNPRTSNPSSRSPS
jgi:hypothetical protein